MDRSIHTGTEDLYHDQYIDNDIWTVNFIEYNDNQINT